MYGGKDTQEPMPKVPEYGTDSPQIDSTYAKQSQGMPCTGSPTHTMGAPWPLCRSWQLVQRLVLGREPGALAACGGLGHLLAALQVPACSFWNLYLPWQALGQACWSLQAINGYYVEYFPHRITISIVAASLSFPHPPPFYPHQSLRSLHSIFQGPSCFQCSTGSQSVSLLSWRWD